MKVKKVFAAVLMLAVVAAMMLAVTACSDEPSGGGDGISEYVLEAEYMDIKDVAGAGISSNQSGYSLIYGDGTDAQKELGWSSGYYIGYTHTSAFSMDFTFEADKDATATIVIRLGSEIGNITLTPESFEIKLNGTSINYGSMFVEGGNQNMSTMEFFDKTLTSTAQLKAGTNTINVSVHSNELRNGQTGGPMIDCVKVTTGAALEWTSYTDNPSHRGGI